MASEPSAEAREGSTPEREWWLRTLAVFQSPQAVFAALRNDSDEQAEARQEPALALVLLSGIAGVLLTHASGRLLDQDIAEDSLLIVAVLVFFMGGIYGAATYWLGGALLHLGIRGAGGRGTYRQSRHTLAFAVAPLALSLLVVWPVRLAVYGGDSFRSGGSDEGLGEWVFIGLSALFVVWSLALLTVAISVVNGWTLLRGVVAIALAALPLALIAALAAGVTSLAGG